MFRLYIRKYMYVYNLVEEIGFVKIFDGMMNVIV